MSTGHDIETEEVTGAFNKEVVSRCVGTVQRDDEGATDLATTGQVLVAAYLAEAATGTNREGEFGGPVPE